MLIFASQTLAHGTWNITPEEPATLQLALVGLGTLAVYAVLTGWRPNRKSLASDSTSGTEHDSIEISTPGMIIKRAA